MKQHSAASSHQSEVFLAEDSSSIRRVDLVNVLGANVLVVLRLLSWMVLESSSGLQGTQFFILTSTKPGSTRPPLCPLVSHRWAAACTIPQRSPQGAHRCNRADLKSSRINFMRRNERR